MDGARSPPHPLCCRVLARPRSLLAGIRQASPEAAYLLCLDDDVLLHPGLLAALVRDMEADPSLFMATGRKGSFEPPPPPPPPPLLLLLLHLLLLPLLPTRHLRPTPPPSPPSHSVQGILSTSPPTTPACCRTAPCPTTCPSLSPSLSRWGAPLWVASCAWLWVPAGGLAVGSSGSSGGSGSSGWLAGCGRLGGWIRRWWVSAAVVSDSAVPVSLDPLGVRLQAALSLSDTLSDPRTCPRVSPDAYKLC